MVKLYSPIQVSFAGENKWRCLYCGFNDNAKINANWIKDRLFKCPKCEGILEGLGRIWWPTDVKIGDQALTDFF